MPIYTKHNVKTLGRDIVAIPFSFAPNGSSAVAQTSIIGQGIKSVTWTDVGDFDILLNKTWDVVCATFGVRMASDDDVGISSFRVSGATVSITNRTAGTSADIAADAANRLGGVIAIKNSGLGK